LLKEWNATKTEYQKDQSIQEWLEGQAQRSPKAVALVCGEEELTYEELNKRSNQLANYLRQMGIGPEVRLGFVWSAA